MVGSTCATTRTSTRKKSARYFRGRMSTAHAGSMTCPQLETSTMLAPNAEPAVVDAPVAARADCEAVASAFPCATEAGLEVLRGGGSAKDAGGPGARAAGRRRRDARRSAAA